MKSRAFLIIAIISITLVALWAFLPMLGSYDDANAAPFEITKVELERDHSDYWLTLTLKGDIPATVDSDFGLITPSGQLVRGVEAEGQSLPMRFWINAKELEQPLQLRLQGQTLQVKVNQGLPELTNEDHAVFYQSDWSQ